MKDGSFQEGLIFTFYTSTVNSHFVEDPVHIPPYQIRYITEYGINVFFVKSKQRDITLSDVILWYWKLNIPITGTRAQISHRKKKRVLLKSDNY